jgi:hypothetical protein
VLRKFAEPRIHAAIVCASVSCPSLRRSPWTANGLDAQLAEAMQRFLARPDKGLRIDEKLGSVTLSRIFEWFEDDFATNGGVIATAKRYAPPADRAWFEQNPTQTVRYFEYDWNLNDLARAP